jgi:hypothetical protein
MHLDIYKRKKSYTATSFIRLPMDEGMGPVSEFTDRYLKVKYKKIIKHLNLYFLKQ